MKRALVIAAAVVALAVLVIVSIRAGGGDEGAEVYLERVERRAIARVVKASGEIDPRVKVNISAHVIGKIERLHVAEGDRIERGAPFLELEKEAFLAARDRAGAELEIARSRLRQAEIDLEDSQLRLKRMERLHGEGVVSIEQLEQAQLGEKSARLGLEQAKEAVIQARATLDKAADDLRKTTIYGPLTGRVIELNAEEGEVVVSGTMNNPASVIGTIADLSEILAVVDVDETEIVYVELDQPVTLEVDALPERTYSGRVVEIGSSGFSRPQQPDVTFFEVEVLLDDTDPALRPGMSVRAEIATAEHGDALVIPIQAVVDRKRVAPADEGVADDGPASGAAPPEEGATPEEGAAELRASRGREADGPASQPAAEAPAASPSTATPDAEIPVVFVFDDGTARQTPVETGLSDATHVEIIRGLGEGDRVVTGPYRDLRDLADGDPIRPRDDDEEDDEDG